MAAVVGVGSGTIPLNIANITELVIPNMATKWFEMGLQLGVDPKELSYIESDTPSSKTACVKMFTEWLSNSKTQKSWEKLLTALSSRSVRENTLADNLRGKIKATHKPSDGAVFHKIPMAKVVSVKKEADAEMCAEALTDNFANLTAALPIRNLLPKFISKRIVMFRDQERILAGETDEEKRTRFLKHITDQLTSGSTDSFYKFLEILKKHGGSYSYLASDIEKRLDELQEATVTAEPVTVQDSETVHLPEPVETSDVAELTEEYSVMNNPSETVQCSGDDVSTDPRNYPGCPQLNLYSFTHPPSTLVRDNRQSVSPPPTDAHHMASIPPSSSVIESDELRHYHSQQPSQSDDSQYHIVGTTHGPWEVFSQEQTIHGQDRDNQQTHDDPSSEANSDFQDCSDGTGPDYPQLLRHSFSELPSTLVKDNGGPKPIPVQPADSADSEGSRNPGSSQSEPHQGSQDNQDNQTDQPNNAEANNLTGQDETPQHDNDFEDAMSEIEKSEMTLPGSNYSSDPKHKPPWSITTPPPSTPNGEDINEPEITGDKHPSSRPKQPSRWTEPNNNDTQEHPSPGPSSAPPSLDRNNDTAEKNAPKHGGAKPLPGAQCEQIIPLGFDVPTLKELNDHVRPKVAPKWYDLGVELLSIERVDKLNVIRHDNPLDAEACCTEMFKFWLQEDTMVSWTKLVRALRSPAVDQIVLADEIEKKFITVPKPDESASPDADSKGDSRPSQKKPSDEGKSKGKIPPNNQKGLQDDAVPSVDTDNKPMPSHDSINGPQHNGTHLEDEEENKPPSLSDDDAEGTDDVKVEPSDLNEPPDNHRTDQGYHDARSHAWQLLDGLIWTGLTCSTGLAGYFISSHLFDDEVGMIVGALCSVTTGGGLVYLNVIPPVEH